MEKQNEDLLPAIAETFSGIEVVKDDQGERMLRLSNGEDVPFTSEPLDATYYNPQSLQGDPTRYAKLLGKFVLPDEIVDELKVIPLCQLRVTRTLWPSDSQGDSSAKPLCRSMDGETPADSIMSPISPRCGNYNANGRDVLPRFEPECPSAKFGPNGEAPDCSESRYIVFFDVELMAPIGMWFKGVAISEWNRFAAKYFKDLNAKKFVRRGKEKEERAKNIVYDFKLKPEKNRVGMEFTKSDFLSAKEINALVPVLNLYKEFLLKKQEMMAQYTAAPQEEQQPQGMVDDGASAKDVNLETDESKAQEFDID